jgi:hypothetical protein
VPAGASSAGRQQLIMLVLYWFMTMDVHASVWLQWMTCLMYVGRPPRSARVSPAYWTPIIELWFSYVVQPLLYPLQF